jgi:hypothetical protein
MRIKNYADLFALDGVWKKKREEKNISAATNPY